MQKKIQLGLAAITVLYTILYPIFFYGFLLSSLVFDSSRMSIPLGLSYMFAVLLIPLSVPVALYLMWKNYVRGNYKRALKCSLLPLPVIFFTLVVCFALDQFFFRANLCQ